MRCGVGTSNHDFRSHLLTRFFIEVNHSLEVYMKQSTATLCTAAIVTSVFGASHVSAADRVEATEVEAVSIAEFNENIKKGEKCTIKAVLIEAEQAPTILAACHIGTDRPSCW